MHKNNAVNLQKELDSVQRSLDVPSSAIVDSAEKKEVIVIEKGETASE